MPPMPGSWGPPPMTYPPYPPWVGWYGPWAPPPMHFHPGWLGPTGGFGHRGYYIGNGVKEVSASSRTRGSQDRKTRQSGTPNRMVKFGLKMDD
jgi:hypothetical protein